MCLVSRISMRFTCEIRDGLYFKLSDWFCNQLENSFDSEFCIE